MARRRRHFGLASSQHAEAGARAGNRFRDAMRQSLLLAKTGNCKAAIFELAEAGHAEGRMAAHGRSRRVSKRSGTRYTGRLYRLTDSILKLCAVSPKR